MSSNEPKLPEACQDMTEVRAGVDALDRQLVALLAVGVLGGFTTFSSFSLDAVLLLERRAYGAAGGYVAGSVLLSILAVMLGLFVMRKALA